ncbi:hypothetical protein HZB02_02195 [Candidatus Woesearchaeota archaeon]|nr:hypothetical protein [Candidatus Woesearchaeota archaeon]
MKPFIDIERYVKYFNQDMVQRSHLTATINKSGRDYSASLLMRTKHSYDENYTLEFNLAFEHKQHGETGVHLQKGFRIEHHPPGKSRHEQPHVQIHIHGTTVPQKVGKLWITLPLPSDVEYHECIEGFFGALKDIIAVCQEGLQEEMLNLPEINKLATQKAFLLDKIHHSLLHNKIEYEDASGNIQILTPDTLPKILKKDTALLPFFKKP